MFRKSYPIGLFMIKNTLIYIVKSGHKNFIQKFSLILGDKSRNLATKYFLQVRLKTKPKIN